MISHGLADSGRGSSSSSDGQRVSRLLPLAKLTHILLANGGTLCREVPQAPFHWLSLSLHALLCRVRFLRPLPYVFALLRRV
jgi:hypothetical protein